MCHPSVKPGPPSPTAQELSVFIKDVILASECLKLTQLCPVVGKMAWVLYIDVMCLDHDGNLRDASIAAAMAALNSLRLPEVEYDEEMDQITVSKSKNKYIYYCFPLFPFLLKTFFHTNQVAEWKLLQNKTLLGHFNAV